MIPILTCTRMKAKQCNATFLPFLWRTVIPFDTVVSALGIKLIRLLMFGKGVNLLFG